MKLKTLKYYALAILTSAFVFTSCEEEPIDYEEPILEFTGVEGNTLTINFATTEDHSYALAFTVNVDAPAGIKEFKLHRVKLNGATEVADDVIDITTCLNNTECTYNFSDLILFSHFVTQNFDKIEYQFIVTDNEDQVVDKVFTVTENTAFPTTREGYTYHISAPETGAWNLDADVAVASTGVAADKHIINSDSPGSFTGKWISTEPNGNGTLFVKVTGYDFTAGLVKSAQQLYAAGTTSTIVNAPAVNDVYIAKLADKYYVIKVTNINPTEGTSTQGNKGKITFSYKKY